MCPHSMTVQARCTAHAINAPDIVMTDVAYLPLAAAGLLGIPSVSLCSLNWADIFRHYCTNKSGAENILREIESAY